MFLGDMKPMQRSMIVPTAFVDVQTEAIVGVRQRNEQPLYPGAIIETQEMEVRCIIKLGNYII